MEKNEYNENEINTLNYISNIITLITNLIKFILTILLLIYKFRYKVNKIENEIQENKENIFPNNFSDLSDERELGEEYFSLCQNGTLIGKDRYKRNENPKFTIILPVYNREKYITRVLRSIQNQSYKNIEIILVDDFSQDNSIKIIQQHQRKDKRIRLIKHNKNKGTLITRNDGALNARGKFITFVDPDDILYPGILKKLSGATEIYNTDIIRFDAFFRTEEYIEKYDYYDFFKRNQVITQPEIFRQTFYELDGEIQQHNLFLWGKIIRRELFLELLENLTDHYKKQYWTLYEDNAIDFVLLKFAKTYSFIEANGYIYCYNNNSSFSNKNDRIKANKSVKDVFLLAEMCFDYTNDDEYEKSMAFFQLKRLLTEFRRSLNYLTKGFEYYYRTLDKFSKCKYISDYDRRIIETIRDIIQNAEKNQNEKMKQKYNSTI